VLTVIRKPLRVLVEAGVVQEVWKRSSTSKAADSSLRSILSYFYFGMLFRLLTFSATSYPVPGSLDFVGKRSLRHIFKRIAKCFQIKRSGSALIVSLMKQKIEKVRQLGKKREFFITKWEPNITGTCKKILEVQAKQPAA
jgi:hypothetical protein